MSNSKKIAQTSIKKNYIYNTIYQVLSLITPLITAPYISRVLGSSGVGIYSYTNSIVTYFTLFAALGTASYGQREIAMHRNDSKASSKLFWEIEFLSITTTAVSLIIWLIWICVSTQYTAVYGVLTLSVLAVAFDISWYFGGFEKFKYIVIRNTVVKITGIENEFKEVIGDRIAGICSEHNVTVDYAFQDINDIPGVLPEGRTKPWGTGQAVLAAKNVLTTPFIVINADDYYGKEGFRAVHEYLVNGGQSCMAGFVLKNTLSDNGGVTRGICKMDAENNLTEVVETKNIIKTTEGAEADGMKLDIDSLVSMNMWGLTPDFLKTLEEGFKEFFEKEVPANPLKAEYLIPTFIGELLSEGKISVKALRTNDTWYGMTYKEDVAAVKESFSKMLENGTYKGDLFSDL